MSRRAQPSKPSRRNFLKGAGVAVASAAVVRSSSLRAGEDPNWKVQRGNINQSVVPWCFKDVTVPDLAKSAAAMGLKSVELCDPKFFPELKKLGLSCAIASSHGFEKGLNRIEHHAECIEKMTKSIDAMSAFGGLNVITFSGMRKGLSDEEGIANTVAGLKKIIGYAEKMKVNLCFEVLNSRVAENMKGHPDYQADKIEWAIEVCDKVGSPRMKILFDIYHVQIMQGDVITRIKKYKDYISHYHTAGVPGRAELDDTQEINYPPIMKTILETGYKGFVGQEFIPKYPDKMASLRQAAKLCDV